MEDAHGQPPTMPFWFGEAPGPQRRAVARRCRALRAEVDARLEQGEEPRARWLHEDLRLPPAAAQQLVRYLAAAKAALGVLPTPASASCSSASSTRSATRTWSSTRPTARASTGPGAWRCASASAASSTSSCRRGARGQHRAVARADAQLPAGRGAHYLKPATARDMLVQALLDAPMFATRWRWNATAALAVRRIAAASRVPPQFQRTDAEDLLAVVFPDQLACAENIVGEREIPDHPLVAQTLHDCLHETDGRRRPGATADAHRAGRGRDHRRANSPRRRRWRRKSSTRGPTPSSTTARPRSGAPRRCSTRPLHGPADRRGHRPARSRRRSRRCASEAWPDRATPTSCTMRWWCTAF